MLVFACLLGETASAQTGKNAPQPATSAPAAPTTRPTATAPVSGEGLALYRKLRDVGLDPAAVYDVRDAAIEREDIHITLDDGTIGFVRAVDGRVTGAFFEGEGEVLLFPPDQAERGSLALFTGAAVLEEKFTNAYFRFNDDTGEELKPSLRPVADAALFLEKYDKVVRRLAEADALRLMTKYLNGAARTDDRLFRARLQGDRLGVFDVYFDTLTPDQITVMKLTYTDGVGYYDLLCSFPMRSIRNSGRDQNAPTALAAASPADEKGGATLRITKYAVKTTIDPPNQLSAEAQLDVDVLRGGERIEFFELSRYLKVSSVEADGKPVEFLQNEAIEGSALARRGNDVTAVVFPEPLRAAQKLHLKFTYAGNVLSDAGGGLLYVGARGIWYPNRGLLMADYDLQFRYPQGWTLVATGKRVSHENSGGEQVSHYVSERPIPVAGFNLGRYSMASATASGKVRVEAYAAAGMERTFAKRQAPLTVVEPPPPWVRRRQVPDVVLPPKPAPEPNANAEMVAQRSAKAIDFFSKEFGPYPYSSLDLAQMPGHSSQGWPGLVFLSSYAFLTPDEMKVARLGPRSQLRFNGFIQAHETAHQWWGDLIGWKSYRDQWLVEALAGYSAYLEFEKEHPAESRQFLQDYRSELLAKNPQGEEVASAGPVTLGVRLSSSHFPEGFDVVSYGRGVWLMHMLRTLMRDAAGNGDEPFLRGLRELCRRYAGKEMSTADFLRVMEEEMPLKYDGSNSLQWFYESWIKGTAIPRLGLKDVKMTRRGEGVMVTGKIVQTDAPDELVTAVPVYAQVRGRMHLLGHVFTDGKETGFHLSVPAGAKNVVIDPYDTVLKR